MRPFCSKSMCRNTANQVEIKSSTTKSNRQYANKIIYIVHFHKNINSVRASSLTTGVYRCMLILWNRRGTEERNAPTRDVEYGSFDACTLYVDGAFQISTYDDQTQNQTWRQQMSRLARWNNQHPTNRYFA